MAQSTETLPNGLQLLQDDRFCKLGQDSVLLSAFAKPRRNAKLLDLGCGTGALALLVWRSDLKITGLELQDGPLDLFRQSIAANELEHVSATRRISTATQARMRRPPKSAPQGRTQPARSRNWRLLPRSCCIPAAKPRSYSGRNGCGCCSRRFRACGSCRKECGSCTRACRRRQASSWSSAEKAAVRKDLLLSRR